MQDNKTEYIKWRGGQLNLSFAETSAHELISLDWILKKWDFQPALIDKSGSSQLYTGQKYDSKYFDLVDKGWSHDHCEICSWTISSVKNDSTDNEAYYNGWTWICTKCFDRFLKPLTQKISSIIELNPEDRYSYFVGKIADFEKVWSLRKKDGWATMGDDKGKILYPFFPEKIFADLMVQDKWTDYYSESIELDDFVEKWLPGMTNDKIDLAIIPTPENKGIIVNPDKVLKDLIIELEQYK